MSVTLKDIARESGVSIATVSKVLRDQPESFIGEATRSKVTAVARRLGYRQNQYARSLRTGKSELIGLMAFDVNIRVVLRKLEAVDQAVRARGYRTAVWSAAGQPDAELRALDECRSQQADGLIVVHPSAFLTAAVLRPILDAGIPLLTLDPVDGLAADCVTIDRRHGARAAVAHLLEQGHRRIGFIHGDLRYDTDLGRLRGYRLAHEEADTPVDDRWFVEARAGYGGGYDAARELLARGLGFTAVFCNNDEMAIGALRAFREAGLRVPEDVAVVGFDDIEAAEFAAIPLTTVAQPVEEQATLAVERLFSRLEKPDEVGPPALRLLVPRLVVRDSSGPSRPFTLLDDTRSQ